MRMSRLARLRRGVDQHPHPVRLRDAARRVQALRLRQGPVDVRPGGLHPHQARDVLHRRVGPDVRILLVGSGGVGSAFTAIAARRDFFERCVVADYDEAGHARRSTRWGTTGSWQVRSMRRTPARSSRSSVSTGITHVMNAVDPRFVMPIFNGAYAGGADYLDMAMSLSHPHPDAPYSEMRGEARRRAVRRCRRVGEGRPARAGRDRRGAGAVRRVRALRRRPPVLRDRRARHARRRQPRGRGLRVRAVVLDLDDDRGVPQPAGGLGEGPRLVHHRRRSASRRPSTSPRASGRSSASTSSTRKCC